MVVSTFTDLEELSGNLPRAQKNRAV